MTIRLRNGEELSEQVDIPKGEPENPMSDEEFEERFVDLLKYAGCPVSQAKRIIEVCREETNSVADLCRLL